MSARGFHQDGFAAIQSFVEGDTLLELQGHVECFIRDVLPRLPAEHVFYENKRNPASLKQIQRMGDHDPWFHDLLTAGPFRQLAEELLRGPVVPKNLQYFDKPAGSNRPTPAHQDGFYFMLAPCEALTMWLALDDVDESTGCVRYLRGSHRRGLREHAPTQTLGFSQGVVDYSSELDGAQEQACPVQAGTLLVHHALTIHRADGNRSPSRSRRSLGFIYYSERACEDAASHAAYQRKLADDWRAEGRI